MTRILPIMLVVASVSIVGGCSRSPAPSPETQTEQAAAGAKKPGPALVGTIHEIMEDIVEPSADVVWDSTAILVDAKGTHNFAPKTDADWEHVRRNALMLVESMNLVVQEGRKIVPPGEKMGPGGTLDEAGIAKRIVDQRDDFLINAANLQDVARRALAAIDKRDLKAVDAAGAQIDAACEACHKQFWYPDEPKKAS